MVLIDDLEAMVSGDGDVAGLRVSAWYRPVGGRASKLSPPTYLGEQRGAKRYVCERRYDHAGELAQVVLLDSIQAEANRCEEALLQLADSGRLALPYLELVAEVAGWHVRLTSLDAPHRSRDAYFRDSMLDDTDFEKSEIGLALRRAERHALRPFLEHSPADIVFGFWDSQRGGKQTKISRAYVSEMIGWVPEVGERAAGRFDPLVNMLADASHITRDAGDRSGWRLDEKGKGKLSEVNLGMVPPAPGIGGVSVQSVQRVAYLNGIALSRLGFATSAADLPDPTADVPARALLAALAVVADRAAFARAGVFLRSGCDLVLEREELHWVRRGGDDVAVTIDLDAALAAYADAVDRVRSVGLGWRPGALRLGPKDNLRQLLEQAYVRAPAEES